MKILMVNKFLYPKGGAETHCLEVGRKLEELGHEVQYFGMYDEKNTVKNNLNIYSNNLDFHTKKLNKIFYPFKIIYSFDAKKKIDKIIKDFKPDIIHLNNINFQLTPSIIDCAYKNKIPVVQTVHDYQMICPNHFLYNFSQKQMCERCIKGSKWSCTKYKCIHNSKLRSILGSLEGILYSKVLSSYDKVSLYICPSKFLESELLKVDRYKEKTTFITNFIDVKDVIDISKKEDYILYFGRLSEEKGINELIEAVKKLPNIKLKIAGTGPLEDKVKNIDNIDFVGFKTGEELTELISRAKFAVYPSIWYENCPLSILEAQSCGTPVLTANYGGMKELIEQDETGILLDSINVETLKEGIYKLYEDDEKIEKMSKKCLSKRKDMMNLDKYVSILLKKYMGVIK